MRGVDAIRDGYRAIIERKDKRIADLERDLARKQRQLDILSEALERERGRHDRRNPDSTG